MKVLVTGATGTVGGYLTKSLLKKGIEVSALVRNPSRGDLPGGVWKVPGDLSDASSFQDALKGIDCLFLLLRPDGDPTVIQYAKAAGVSKIIGVSDGTKYPTEDALYQSDIPWTMLFPLEFMKNALIFWKDSIRYELTAKTPFPDSKGAQIHERDIADAAAAVILQEGHIGKSYYLTGPEIITPRSRIEDISRAIGRPVTMIVQTEQEARTEYASWGFSPELIDYAIESTKNPDPYMYSVQPTVEQLTGHPARTFAQWAQEHAADFLP